MILLTAAGFGADALFGFGAAPAVGVLLGLVLAQFVPARSACSIDRPPAKTGTEQERVKEDVSP